MHKSTTILALITSALAEGITQANFTGTGTIAVWNSNDWRNASPANRVGCMSSSGRFINPSSESDCGIFTREAGFPYTLSTAGGGNCTFTNENQERNTDSVYGWQDHAWVCEDGFVASIYDELYTIDGFSHVFLCTGDIDCYFDAKHIPPVASHSSSTSSKPSNKTSTAIWPFRWGSQQTGITPGHVMLQLVWNKIDDGKASPKGVAAEEVKAAGGVRAGRKGGKEALGQVPFLGPRIG